MNNITTNNQCSHFFIPDVHHDTKLLQQIQGLWTELQVKQVTIGQKRLAVQKYHALNFEHKYVIEMALWIAFFRPSELHFATKKISEDPYILLRCKNNQGENILEQLLIHYKSIIDLRTTIPAFLAFKEQYFKNEHAHNSKIWGLSFSDLANSSCDFIKIKETPLSLTPQEMDRRRLEAFNALPQTLKNFLYHLIEKHLQKSHPHQDGASILNQNPSVFTKFPSILQEYEQIFMGHIYNIFEAFDIQRGLHQFSDEYHQSLNNINCSSQFKLYDEKGLRLLRVAMVTAELTGVISKGGLSSAVAGMAGAYGKDKCVIILPKYDVININIKFEEKTYVIKYADKINRVYKAKVNGFKCFFIDDELFKVGTSYDKGVNKNLPNNIYEGHGIVYKDVVPDTEKKWRFIRFSSLAAEFVYSLSRKSNNPIQLVHCHDAQTALIPELLVQRHFFEWREGKTPATVLTFHNNNDQMNCNYNSGPGKNTHYLLEEIGLPGKDTNCLVKGIEASDMVTTVSRTFAKEALGERDGKGIQNTMRAKASQGKLVGIVNGDSGNFNPITNKPLKLWKTLCGESVDLTYGPDDADLPQKIMRIRQELCEYLQFHKLGTFDPKKPILFYVGRFDSSQKGIDKLPLIMQTALNLGAQFICIGTDPDERADKYLAKMEEIAKNRDNHGVCIIRDKKNTNDRYEWQQGRDPEKPQDWKPGDIQGCGPLMRAGIDLAVFPSLFEPCGLVQMEMFCMGLPVIATNTGGFANTVIVKGENKNGYLFNRCQGQWSNKDATGLQGEFIVLDDVLTVTNEQDQCITNTVAIAIKDAQNRLGLLYSDYPEAQQLSVAQKRRIMINGFNSTWSGTFYEPRSPIGELKRVYAKAIELQQKRGEIYINLHGCKYTSL